MTDEKRFKIIKELKEQVKDYKQKAFERESFIIKSQENLSVFSR